MKKLLFIVTIGLILSSTSSCYLLKSASEKNKLANEESEKLVKELKESREKVEKQVRLAKSNIKDEAKLNELKSDYTAAQNAFNKTYDKIIESMQEPSTGMVNCVVFKYKRVIRPHNQELKKDAELADKFIENSNKALNPGGAGAGFIAIVKVVLGLFDEFKNARLNTCKKDIEALKYKSWSEIS